MVANPDVARAIIDVLHPTRVKVLRAIVGGISQVTKISEAAGTSTSSTYDALRVFEKYGLVKVEYEGARPKYVATEKAKRILELYDKFIEEVRKVVK